MENRMYKLPYDDFILLSKATNSRCAKQIAKRISSLNELETIPEETQVAMFGTACADRLKALQTFFRRLHYNSHTFLDTAKDVAAFSQPLLAGATEHLLLIHVDHANNPLSSHILFSGKGAAVSVDIAALLRFILLHQVERFFLVHNHPSGDPSPTPDDILVTRSILSISRILGFDFIDHVIVGNTPESYVSIRGTTSVWLGIIKEAGSELSKEVA